MFFFLRWEGSGSVEECLTRDRGATGVTALCHVVLHINPSLVLVKPSKTRPYITERLLMGLKESNQTKQTKHPFCLLSSVVVFFFKINFFEKFFQEYNKCQTVWIQIRPGILLGLIWVQTVCKSYQQTTLVGKE